MRFDRLDLNLLLAMDVLIEECSVSNAAKRLHLSQAAMSGALNRLRDYFGDELLVLSGRQMLLTSKAEALRAPVREALMLIRSRIISPAQFEPATAVRNFTIAASDYASTILLANVLPVAAKVAPGVSFDIVPPSRAAQERFERGEVDLFLTIGPHLLPNHPSEGLFSDQNVVIAWSEGKFQTGVSHDAFFDADHVIVVFGSDQYPAFTETYFQQVGISRKIQVRVPFFSALPLAVVGTDRLAIMWRRLANHFAAKVPIKVFEPPIPLPEVREDAQWHSSRATDQGLKWLLSVIRQEVRTLDSVQPSLP
jgi:LysR family nod box-dependent transcriptional activator